MEDCLAIAFIHLSHKLKYLQLMCLAKSTYFVQTEHIRFVGVIIFQRCVHFNFVTLEFGQKFEKHRSFETSRICPSYNLDVAVDIWYGECVLVCAQ